MSEPSWPRISGFLAGHHAMGFRPDALGLLTVYIINLRHFTRRWIPILDLALSCLESRRLRALKPGDL